MPNFPETAWIEIASDWVCEILSPSTHRYDRTLKRDIYAREQIKHYWIVDPVEQIVKVFELDGARWTLLTTVRSNMTVSLLPFDTMPFDLAEPWV